MLCRYKPPNSSDYDELERQYWKNITYNNPIYGADVSGSITDESQESWNISKLGSILDCLGDDYGISIEGNSYCIKIGIQRLVLDFFINKFS